MSRDKNLMEESSTYQEIFQKGFAIGVRRAQMTIAMRNSVLIVGRKRFGEPSLADFEHLNSINELDRLNRIFDWILDAENWEDLILTQ